MTQLFKKNPIPRPSYSIKREFHEAVVFKKKKIGGDMDWEDA